jgi:cobyrinic acid a,c-diamide synthase
VVLNKLGSDRHLTLIANALEPLGIPVLGAIPRDETLVLPERHLGLVQASEHPDLAARLNRFAELAARHLDLDAIVAMATPLDDVAPATRPALNPPGQRIALAWDDAFSFV